MCRQTAGCSAGTGLRPQGLVAAAGRRPRHGRPNNRGLCRQTAGSNAGTAKAHSRACWKPPRRIWSILVVLRVWSLANGRLERPKNRGLCAGCAPRHGRPNNRGLWRQTAGSNAGTAKAHSRACWKPPRRIRSILGVLRVWSLANGRLERPKNRGLCAGKRQAAALERQRLTATRLGGSCCEAP